MTTVRWMVLSLAALVAFAASAASPGDRVVRLDGQAVAADVSSIDAQGVVKAGDGTYDLQQLRKITRPVEADRLPMRVFRIYLRDGGVIVARKVQVADGSVVFDWSLGKAQRWPIGSVRAVLLVPLSADESGRLKPEAAFAEALDNPGEAADALFVMRDDGIRVVRGALESLGAEQARFVWNQRSRTIARDKLYGLTLATANGAPDLAGQVRVHLRGGSTVWGAVQGFDGATLKLKRDDGVALDIAWDRVMRLDVRSRYMMHLSDMQPLRIDYGDPFPLMVWPMQRDALVMSHTGRPITLGGRTFDKGLGVRSDTRVSYAIAGKYDRFAATVGFDDYHGRQLGEGEFRVTGDGKLLFRKKLTAEDAPLDISVDVTDVRKLELYLDPLGDATGDSAAWADARLIRDVK